MSSQADDTPCTLLLNINGQLVDVAKSSIMKPLDRMLHNVQMPDGVFRVFVARVLSDDYSQLPLPIPTGGEEDPTKLEGCKGWMLM